MGNDVLVPSPAAAQKGEGDPPATGGTVQCRERLSGVLRHYYRQAG
jgi:hypothetical protein